MLTLRRKFAILLSGLAAGVLAVQATAAWSIITLEREIAWPLRSVESVLRRLHSIKQDAESLSIAMGRSRWTDPSAPLEPDPARAEALAASIRSQLDELDGPESYLIRTGLASTRTLRRQSEAAMDAAVAAANDPSKLSEATRALSVVHELIGRIENHILNDARFQTDHALSMRQSVMIVSGACLGALGLTVLLGLLLFTRWIIAPVKSLRAATLRIATGDYEHRVAVRGTDEMAQLSAEVNQMAQTIDSMTRERVDRERLAAIGEMVRRVAHNLRNPLAGIRSLAEVTRAELDEGSELKDVQTRIIQTVDRFETWLRDLLRSTSPLHMEPVELDLVPWLPEALAALRPLAESRRVRLDVRTTEASLRVRADPAHLEQAVVAVVTNAIQAVAAKGWVDVRLSVEAAGGALIEVIDDGPGVAIELRERIFEPYFTSKPDGTGIGLALARHVIQQHHGTIDVGNRRITTCGVESPKIGACFCIRIPSAAEH